VLDPYSEEPNLTFIILAPEHNCALIKTTVRSINNRYGENIPRVCVVGKDTSASELKELKEICPIYRGKDTFTSLVNQAMTKAKTWAVFLTEGCIVRPNLPKKYNRFLSDVKDVVFPIVVDYNKDGHPVKLYTSFENSTFNGLCVHHDTFKKVGKLDDSKNLEEARLLWATSAMEMGVKFKAILGAKIV